MGCVRFRRGKWVLDYRDQYGIRRYESTKYTKKEDKEKVVKLLGNIENKVDEGKYQDKKSRHKIEDLIEKYRKGVSKGFSKIAS